MPIYRKRNGQTVVVRESSVLNEGLFKKKEVPREFITFATSVYDKLSKKLVIRDIKGVDAKTYVKNNPKRGYTFGIEHENYSPGQAAMAAGLNGAVFGYAGSSLGARATAEYRIELERKCKSLLTGLKEKRSTVFGANTSYFYKLSSDKKYVFSVEPYVDAVPSTGGNKVYLNVYQVNLFCNDATDKVLKKLGESTSFIESEIPGFDDAAKNPDGKLDLSSIFAGFEPENKPIIPAEELKHYQPYPELKKAFNEHFDIMDDHTRKTLMAMNEAEHNTALTALTSKLYDQIVSKAHNIDFGEIPKTKGDITKLSNYETLKETLGIIKGIVTEYKQDTKCIDEVSVAMTNIQGRKDMFERAFRGNCEMPMLMYDNMVMAVVVGTSYLITACIEFIKAPRDESFTIQLDKVAYNKSKDHLIYTSISKFNHMCENGDFDQAMNMIIDKKIRKFTGITIAGGIAVGVIILTNIIPLLRELVYLFYHTRVTLSDYYETQADLLTMNAYNLQHNDVRTSQDDKNEIIEKQNKVAEKFRKMANFFAIKNKKAEVAATKDIENSAKKYKLDADANIVSDEPDESDSGSALF